jgi:uncharacterized delta-60 repeat protein
MSQDARQLIVGARLTRVLILGLVAGVVVVGSAQAIWAAAGDLDPTFDSDGRQVFRSSTSDDRGQAVAVQADGKIVVVGDTNFFGSTDVQLVRFSANGSPDPTFDGDGRRIYLEPAAEDRGQAVALQPNGKIVVAGYTNLFGTNDILLLRFHPDATLDTTFDSDGRRVFINGGDDRAQAVVVQPDGKLVVAGYTNLLGTADILVLRFNANGSLDSSFDGDGRVVLSGPGNERAQGVALQPDGKIIVAGYTDATGGNDFSIVRFNVNGSLDGTFGNGGRQVISGFGGNDQAQALVLQSDGRIVVAGFTNVTGTNDFAVVRLNANGSLDISFDIDGRLVISGFGGDDRAQAVAVQSDGKIVLAGYTNVSGNNDFAVARVNANGTLDATFDGDGRLITRSFAGDDRVQALALQLDGKIIAAGYTNGLGTNDVAVARYLTR